MMPATGDQVPIVTRTPDAIDLFMFSAASWLIHRVHYDVPFTTEHDGHPGLLVHGPLQGVYLVQCVQRWLGRDVRLRSISYRHSAPAYLGDTLECGGTVVAAAQRTITVDVWARKADGTETTRGNAVFEVME